ncbi:hypothetical protein CJ030_MR3G008358 [Morella rubra]|uniref:Uncharacterized protein n=1 Tax=Morella rubra TaxID=262757 RepID=A0A6A1W251_9ROSI|nr:hypothetical protein CJ030_MR3G008358 [Morella rubra]
MTCHDPSHDQSSSALARPMALLAPMSAPLGHMPRHGLEKVSKEMMRADLGGVKDYFASITTWPPTTAVQEEVHGEIVSGGSHDRVEEIGSTTTRPPEAVTHNEAHRGVSSKELACEGNILVSPPYKVVEWRRRRKRTVAATTGGNQMPYRVSHPYIAESPI